MSQSTVEGLGAGAGLQAAALHTRNQTPSEEGVAAVSLSPGLRNLDNGGVLKLGSVAEELKAAQTLRALRLCQPHRPEPKSCSTRLCVLNEPKLGSWQCCISGSFKDFGKERREGQISVAD